MTSNKYAPGDKVQWIDRVYNVLRMATVVVEKMHGCIIVLDKPLAEPCKDLQEDRAGEFFANHIELEDKDVV